MLALACCGAIARERYVIITDFGGVAATVSENMMMKQIMRDPQFKAALSHSFHDHGILTFLKDAFSLCKRSSLRSMLYAVMEHMGTTDHEIRSCDQHGTPLPRGHYELQAGLINCRDAIERLPHALSKARAQNIFANDLQEELVAATIRTIFKKDIFTITMAPNAQFIKLFEQATASSQKNNFPEIIWIILSNFSEEQFEALRTSEQFAPLLSQIPQNQQIISGSLHRINGVKPEPAIFQLAIEACCKEYAVSPDHIIFLDDQIENCDGMRAELEQNGVARAVACNNVFWIKDPQKSIKNVRRILRSRNILAPKKESRHKP